MDEVTHEYGDDGEDIPQRTEFVLTVSMFPAIPMDEDLTDALAAVLRDCNKAAMEAFLDNVGLSTSLDLRVDRMDIIHESSTIIISGDGD